MRYDHISEENDVHYYRRHRSMNYPFEDENIITNEYIDYWLSTAWD
nr:MAG TPA: hypothetical protein [Caudoviricetes sp.]